MIEKIKKKIDENKKDRETYKKYIKSFCNTGKAKELFKDNDEFEKLKKISGEKEKEEY